MHSPRSSLPPPGSSTPGGSPNVRTAPCNSIRCWGCSTVRDSPKHTGRPGRRLKRRVFAWRRIWKIWRKFPMWNWIIPSRGAAAGGRNCCRCLGTLPSPAPGSSLGTTRSIFWGNWTSCLYFSRRKRRGRRKVGGVREGNRYRRRNRVNFILWNRFDLKERTRCWGSNSSTYKNYTQTTLQYYSNPPNPKNNQTKAKTSAHSQPKATTVSKPRCNFSAKATTFSETKRNPKTRR